MSRGQRRKKKIWCINTARMWCCNTFWEKWVTLQVIPEEQKCFTDELCHCATLRQTMLQQQAYALAYLATRGKRFLVLFRLLYVGWFVLPTIYEEMWTEILTEIKKTLWKETFRLRRWLLSPCCSAPCIFMHKADTLFAMLFVSD